MDEADIKVSTMATTGRGIFIKADSSMVTTHIEEGTTTEASNTAKTGTTTITIATKASITNNKAIRATKTTTTHIVIKLQEMVSPPTLTSYRTNPETTTLETISTTIKVLITEMMVMPLLDRVNKIAILITAMATIEEVSTRITVLATITGILAMMMGKDKESKETTKGPTTTLTTMMT